MAHKRGEVHMGPWVRFQIRGIKTETKTEIQLGNKREGWNKRSYDKMGRI